DRDDVLFARIAWHPRAEPDAGALERAMRPLAGDRDCRAFQSSGSAPVSSCCRITRAGWRRWEGGLQLDIVSNHFLYHMVRTLVGTALVIQRDPDPAAAMERILGSRDRRCAGPTAPPQGLTLEQVFYAAGSAG